ncbi:GNAT family N-acetyltransferase [Streptomyces sp. NBC_00536]|uniref:GNAT family N-acetyltransferase n=1 Tax=Streptomyces sp. NBC_00536 TaxID=2975769 RepID=UPI002E8219FE|nr:GNAT family protein [Streptomyces sp. NBC_00536]WUC77196.1 GNAT family N-acetyltransferase [Streptomyces sp. NBC_00536]
MISHEPVPPVVPEGRMARTEQPVLDLPDGMRLRPWRPDDAHALVAAGLDPSIRLWNLIQAWTEDEARGRIDRMRERWQAESGALWAIARPGDDAAVGLVGWNGIDLAAGTAEILYWILPAARGGGVAVAAARRACHWAFEELGLHRLQLLHAVDNPASCRVADKAGFTLEGTMRSAVLHADGWHDMHLHAMIKGDI